jgi:transposase
LISIVDRRGTIVREGVVESNPEAMAACIASHARIGLGSGATSAWQWTEPNNLRLPTIRIDAGHADAPFALLQRRRTQNDLTTGAGTAGDVVSRWQSGPL